MKRRTFVIKTGLTSVAMATSAFATTKILDANEKLNIGIIGTGDRGSGMIPNINEIKNFNVIACCDVLPFRLENGLKKVANKAKGYSDYRRLLDHKNIDAVLIATPFNTHAKIAMDALEAGKHVYCEKTMAKGFTDIHNLVKKVNDSKSIFQTGHQYHSSRLYSHVVDLIKKGKIGKIVTEIGGDQSPNLI